MDLAGVHTGDGDVGAEDVQKQLVGDADRLGFQHHAAQAAEEEHAGQGADKGRDVHIADPEALPGADDGGNGQADEDDQHGVEGGVGHQLRGDGAYQAQCGAHAQVHVAAGEDAQQHAAAHNQHVSVLQQQVGDVLRVEHFTAGQGSEENENHHQGDDHGVFFQNGADPDAVCTGFQRFGVLIDRSFHACSTPLLSSFFPDCRMAAMIFSCVASSMGNSPTRLPSFMT